MADDGSQNGLGGNSSFSPDSWNVAAKYASLIGPMPSSFSSTIRMFISDQQKAGSPSKYQPSENMMYSLRRIMRSDSLKSPIYFAATSMHSDKIKLGQPLDERQLLEIMGADILSALIGIVYLYRKMQPVCAAKQWESLVQEMHYQMELGAALGYAIPNIGPGVGIFTGALRFLAQAVFLSKDEKGFRAYRRELTNASKSYDLELEDNRWKCNHLQVGAKLLQSLGYGLAYATGFTFGLGAVDAVGLDQDEAMYRWWITGLWIESLRRTNSPPDITHKGKYYPEKIDLDRLMSKVNDLASNGPTLLWMEKRKEDMAASFESQGESSEDEGEVDDPLEDEAGS